jgi:hypothetical protein
MKKIKISLNIPTILGGTSLKKGVHEVLKKDVTDNWFFDALVAGEQAIVLGAIDKVKEKIAEKIPTDLLSISTDEDTK